MALTCRALIKSSFSIQLYKPFRRWTTGAGFKYPIKIVTSGVNYRSHFQKRSGEVFNHLASLNVSLRKFTSERNSCSDNSEKEVNKEEKKKQGLIQKFKEMYRDYWYVLLPVHVATSTIWFASCYYVVRSGVDVVGLLESAGVTEYIIDPLRDSKAGYFALAFACYKIVTPFRYAVTVGVTTFAIKRLTGMGWIKPVPSRERLKEILQEKRENLNEKYQESKEHYKVQMKELKNKVKKM